MRRWLTLLIFHARPVPAESSKFGQLHGRSATPLRTIRNARPIFFGIIILYGPATCPSIMARWHDASMARPLCARLRPRATASNRRSGPCNAFAVDAPRRRACSSELLGPQQPALLARSAHLADSAAAGFPWQFSPPPTLHGDESETRCCHRVPACSCTQDKPKW
ncbi:hypothetical protein P280DRAFT_129659 [Massarina eburnea CBS 473.64]|uniref:Uncharacterized protein n=1 Tax=Massarina eburnea CBS 473.64 TaxID=1395130 RepID=A0A6A6SD93_9PLEO|nr:hypothetical protein P280DRAFT_129659 [Massarina eburnea CBS 473.64]